MGTKEARYAENPKFKGLNAVQHLVPYTRPELDQKTQTELELLVGRRIIGPARSIGYDLPTLGISADVPVGPVYRRTPAGSWAYATDYRIDPAAEQYGGCSPVPEPVLDSLWQMSAAGVTADELIVVHEVDASWQPGRPLPLLVPPAKRFRRHDELLIGATEQLKRGLIVAGAVLGAAAAAPAALLVSPAVGLDPVLMAGVRHPDGPCIWVALAAWNWE